MNTLNLNYCPRSFRVGELGARAEGGSSFCGVLGSLLGLVVMSLPVEKTSLPVKDMSLPVGDIAGVSVSMVITSSLVPCCVSAWRRKSTFLWKARPHCLQL